VRGSAQSSITSIHRAEALQTKNHAACSKSFDDGHWPFRSTSAVRFPGKASISASIRRLRAPLLNALLGSVRNLNEGGRQRLYATLTTLPQCKDSAASQHLALPDTPLGAKTFVQRTKTVDFAFIPLADWGVSVIDKSYNAFPYQTVAQDDWGRYHKGSQMTIRLTPSFFVLSFLSVMLTTGALRAHSGGLNAQGCHAGSRPYHCHRA
jgi:hypothetical protein